MKLEITDVQRVNLQAGDRLVVRLRGRATTQLAATVRAIVRDWAGEDVPVLILDDSASLEVIATEDAPQEIAR